MAVTKTYLDSIPPRNSGRGRRLIATIPDTAPGVEPEMVEVDDNHYWILESVFYRVNTDSTVADRYITFIMLPQSGAGELGAFAQRVKTPASSGHRFQWSPGLTPAAGGAYHMEALGSTLVLPPDSKLRARVINIQAGDTIDDYRIYAREYTVS